MIKGNRLLNYIVLISALFAAALPLPLPLPQPNPAIRKSTKTAASHALTATKNMGSRIKTAIKNTSSRLTTSAKKNEKSSTIGVNKTDTTLKHKMTVQRKYNSPKDIKWSDHYTVLTNAKADWEKKSSR
ncbi:hypothetical protein BJ085DRAFT_32430 [Dimargaris cristalligena]|uniref:Uncharacterized protein n=1 Tax=Dimargaris cristalligena TaxID=215637 RepID=A0A4P9ZKV2_9FUNG|nr:hypothetical protein BJ085DRAFT_32430 [Dimargaris cristalligena]|eukprot:RKP33698.1 hypothetical protein BJ085DRAFT_32430 [Dimargaris cristalligena]